MALKKLLIKKRLDESRTKLQKLEEDWAGLTERQESINSRESEAIKALGEMNEESTLEEREAVEAEAESIEADRESLVEEMEALESQKTEIEAQIRELESALEVEDAPEPEKEEIKERKAMKNEERGQALLEKRNVLISSTGILLPKYEATDIKPTFLEVSSIVDAVNIRVFPGGESFRQPYLKGYGIAAYETEGGANVTNVDPSFGYAQINKTKLVAYTEDSEELVKLPAADFDAEVVRGISVAIRKKLAREILFGDGEAGHFVGIFDGNADAIDQDDKELADINEETLDEIIYAYGGDESVEAPAVLVLNKEDLRAFALLRDATGRKIYEINNRGNFGTIDGVPFIINSHCKAISNKNTTSGQYAMAYGPLSNYTMAIFSDVEVRRSEDYKFRHGLIAHRGVLFAGGNVTAYNGFLRVKKA